MEVLHFGMAASVGDFLYPPILAGAKVIPEKDLDDTGSSRIPGGLGRTSRCRRHPGPSLGPVRRVDARDLSVL